MKPAHLNYHILDKFWLHGHRILILYINIESTVIPEVYGLRKVRKLEFTSSNDKDICKIEVR